MVVSPLPVYISALETELKTGNATEESHRPALKTLLQVIDSSVTATTEPKRIKIGAPDYAITRMANHGPLTVGYIETKDIGASLDETEKSEQMRRYLRGLNNLVLTDYLDFRWYVAGQRRLVARLGTRDHAKIVPDSTGTEAVVKLLQSFLAHQAEPINTPRALAERMARLTHLIRDLIIQAFETKSASSVLRGLRAAFHEVLLPDLSVPEFADMFAQTLAYGLFAARYNHRGTVPFQRLGAASEIPKTNPFLRDLFHTMTGPALNDEPFVGFVDDLAQLLADTDMAAVLADFGKRTGQDDPLIHFYETFLTAYDPKLREKRGVYYTPAPVVSYMVRSVDSILKTHFGLPSGLADTATTAYSRVGDNGKTETVESPRVLILDPACGTGTFLYSVIGHIRTQFQLQGNAGKWSSYVRDSLLLRIFGFELLMPSYAMAHLKLGMELAALDLPVEQRKDWAYDFNGNERLGVYLTNSLDAAIKNSDVYLGQFLSNEANAASAIKTALPIMVVIGNPPYSGHSANLDETTQTFSVQVQRGGKTSNRSVTRRFKTFIGNLMEDYYQVDGQPLRERNSKWLKNDYVKFIRFGQWRIQQTGAGMLAFITSNSYLDGLTHRGMRQNLMQSFTDIYILNLHGNSERHERAPDGGSDQNVFDIQEGVAIALFLKVPNETGPARVHYADLWGNREAKYLSLAEHDIVTTEWKMLEPKSPQYLFLPQSADLRSEYEQGWKITDCMRVKVLGFQSHRDHFALDYDEGSLRSRIVDLRSHSHSDDEIRAIYNLVDNPQWKIATVRRQLRTDGDWEQHFIRCLYRPFDSRSCYYSGSIVDRPRTELQQHMLRPNLSLNTMRQTKSTSWQHALIANTPTPAVFLEIKDGSYAFPLYLYTTISYERGDGLGITQIEPNLTHEFVSEVETRFGFSFISEGIGDLIATVGPEDIFHYIYAVFHAPTYRSRYADLLKTDFPRVPLTRDKELFRTLCAKGKELVALHLMESPALAKSITRYPIPGSDIVDAGYPRYVAKGESEPGTGKPLTVDRLY